MWYVKCVKAATFAVHRPVLMLQMLAPRQGHGPGFEVAIPLGAWKLKEPWTHHQQSKICEGGECERDTHREPKSATVAVAVTLTVHWHWLTAKNRSRKNVFKFMPVHAGWDTIDNCKWPCNLLLWALAMFMISCWLLHSLYLNLANERMSLGWCPISLHACVYECVRVCRRVSVCLYKWYPHRQMGEGVLLAIL